MGVDRRFKGRYRPVSELARGASGVVHLAEDELLGVRCAVKEVPRDALRRLGMEDMLLDEARAMARLAPHPGVLRVIDVGEDEASCFIVTEHAERGSLEARLEREGALEPAEAVTLALKVLDTLAFVHAQGVVHRDIKPGNVLLTRCGEPVIADFGIAAMLDAGLLGPGHGRVLGTRAYMAPEQRRGEPGDARVDIYGAGCTLFELVSGASPMDLYAATEDSPRWQLVPQALRAVIRKATQLAPDRRYADAAEMAAALRGALAELPVGAPKAAEVDELVGQAAILYRSSLAEKGAELRAALAQQQGGEPDAEGQLRRLAHRLHGSGASYGFPGISAAAGELEVASPPELAAATGALLKAISEAARTRTAVGAPALALVSRDPLLLQRVRGALGPVGVRVEAPATLGELEALHAERSLGVVLLDLDSLGDGALDAVSAWAAPVGQPEMSLIALSSDATLEAEVLATGAHGFLSRSAGPVAIAEAVEATMVRGPRDLQIDPGTGLLDHLSFMHKLVGELAGGEPCAFALVQVDTLREEANLPEAWDVGLREVAAQLRGRLTGAVTLARWGAKALALSQRGVPVERLAQQLERVLPEIMSAAIPGLEGGQVRLGGAASGLGGGHLQHSLQRVSEAMRGAARRSPGHIERVAVGAGACILVVDDDPDVAAQVEVALRGERTQVVPVAEGRRAVEVADARRPALIILDVEMPDQDGYRTLGQLRAHAACQDTPILMLTARASERDVMLALEMGADDFLSKPFRPGELRARVRRLIRAAR